MWGVQAEESGEMERPISGSTLSKALQEAEAIVEAARRRAREIEADAEGRAATALEVGYAEGFHRGRKEVAEVAVRFLEEGSTLGERLSAEAARLAITICEKVIGEHLQVSPSTVVRIAKEAIQESMTGERVSVVVHPEDAQILGEVLSELRRVSGGAEVVIEPNPEMGRGGCVVRTFFGEVDASIESLIEAVSAKLGVKR